MRYRNLLIITQTVDSEDSNLGFFCDWIKEFSKQVDHLYVIANKVGQYSFSSNVLVFSLGKENNYGRIRRIFRFWYYLVKYLPRVKSIFVHMCPEYVVYGGWLARLYGKKIGLWYLHSSVTPLFSLSEKLVNYIFTAHRDGIGIRSEKVIVTGHGINLSLFTDLKRKPSSAQLNILTVGRLSSSKDLLILAKSAIILQSKLNKPISFEIVGEAYLPADQVYVEEVKKFIIANNADGIFKFVGKISHENIGESYSRADVFVNASRTGGVDKAVLEALVSGVPVITSNRAFQRILSPECIFTEGDVADLVFKLENYQSIPIKEIREKIIRENNLIVTIKNIVSNLSL